MKNNSPLLIMTIVWAAIAGWCFSKAYITDKKPQLSSNTLYEIKPIDTTFMREQLSNDVRSFVITDDTKLHVVKISEKKFTIVRVGPRSSTVEQLNAKQMKDKYKLTAW